MTKGGPVPGFDPNGPAHAEDVTLGELHRNLVALTVTINQRFAETNARVDAAAGSYMRRDVYSADQARIETRLREIEDGLRWFRRQVVAALVPLVIAAVFAAAHAV